jgi:hypothetical protein
MDIKLFLNNLFLVVVPTFQRGFGKGSDLLKFMSLRVRYKDLSKFMPLVPFWL